MSVLPNPARDDSNSGKDSKEQQPGYSRSQQGRSLGHHQVNVVPHSPELPMPACTMQVFAGDPAKKEVAQNVKIGDMLTLVVELDKQDLYGFKITDCSVRDGLGWAEQKLIDSEGCSTDDDIMGTFQYSAGQSRAEAKFAAHKFPYTASVYYQCNARLCLRENNGCQLPTCDDLQRVRRASSTEDDKAEGPITASKQQQNPDDIEDGAPATIQVYSGLYVNEGADLAGSLEDDVYREKSPEDALCVPQRAFAVGVAVAGLLLMLAVLAAILVLLARRRTRGKNSGTSSSSVYSGPYTNTAYSHSS
ncbi:uncharacterized protein LOC113363220 [Ctenocephalides felis]|uniref:uncharacterized protein LOC113363220 n=1 Tax=Ctenocephalides felis TaxID=7515 RepID=UPI000E6E1054|nr:uncharacterized protein LOC113363220 [Ctenocephalides felis]